ncbi:hypothetical protein U7230_07835 [Carboxydochorda subterranea]|uniref:DUF5666 domain-containing protein n=1 Tax=Carboxydichorda subterranea TaxID=3109565 RepID=A0ABZ1BTB2_9FIRM|nr:hypothetical protein [Limnochorda sp. L945t]WRP16022.1 hypothetical protein U7230_07835 [Limnochorda sp. L945t]
MRRVIRLLALAAVVALAVSAVGFAAATRPSATKPAASASTFSLTGKVTAATPGLLTIAVEKSSPGITRLVRDGKAEVKLTKTTSVRMGKKAVSPSKLAVGETVRVVGRVLTAKGTPAQLVARTVTIVSTK